VLEPGRAVVAAKVRFVHDALIRQERTRREEARLPRGARDGQVLFGAVGPVENEVLVVPALLVVRQRIAAVVNELPLVVLGMFTSSVFRTALVLRREL
jgi:hypothetical protein